MRGMCAAMVALLPTLAATKVSIRASVGGNSLQLEAVLAEPGPQLRPLSDIALILADDVGCTMDKSLAVISKSLFGRPFALNVRRGGCSLEQKARVALSAGAAALIVNDDLRARFAPAPNATVASMALVNPCLVDCAAGRGTVDTTVLDVPTVLAGLPGRCPAPASYNRRPCPTSLCAFSGAAEQSGEREVCCVRETRAAMVVGNESSVPAPTALPVLTLSLARGHALEQACGWIDGATPVGAGPVGLVEEPGRLSPCTLTLTASPPPSLLAPWDAGSLLVWLLASCTAALAAFLAAREAAMQEVEADDGESGGKGGRSAAPGADAVAANIDAPTAFGFLLMASVGLLSLYLLIQAGFNAVRAPRPPALAAALCAALTAG